MINLSSIRGCKYINAQSTSSLPVQMHHQINSDKIQIQKMFSVFRFYLKLKFISCQNSLKLLGKVHRIIIPLIFISNL